MFVFDDFHSSSRFEHHDDMTLVQDLTWCVYLEKIVVKLTINTFMISDEYRYECRFVSFQINPNLPLLQGNVEFSVDTDQNRLVLSLPRYPICIAIEPNMVAYEPRNINYIECNISFNG